MGPGLPRLLKNYLTCMLNVRLSLTRWFEHKMIHLVLINSCVLCDGSSWNWLAFIISCFVSTLNQITAVVGWENATLMVRTRKYTAFTGKKRLGTLMGMERVILLESCLEMNANFNVQKIILVKSNFFTKARAKVSGWINSFPFARLSLFDPWGSAMSRYSGNALLVFF